MEKDKEFVSATLLHPTKVAGKREPAGKTLPIERDVAIQLAKIGAINKHDLTNSVAATAVAAASTEGSQIADLVSEIEVLKVTNDQALATIADLTADRDAALQKVADLEAKFAELSAAKASEAGSEGSGENAPTGETEKDGAKKPAAKPTKSKS